MKRRFLLQAISGLAAAYAMPMSLVPAYGATAPARFLISLCADGGWDPTSLIDPKGNVPRSDGKGPVNRYATGNIRTAGKLHYAPYADGIETPATTSAGHFDTFFAKHAQRLLVINGIDTQTNSHDAGRRFMWSGRLEEGFPAVAAMVAAPYSNQPMAFISNGGYDYTAELVASVRTASAKVLSTLAYPNSQFPDNPTIRSQGFFSSSAYSAIEQARQARLDRLQQQETLPERLGQMAQLEHVRSSDLSLDTLLTKLPATISAGLKGQAEIAVAAFASGLAVGANLSLNGFDTHGNHDQDHSDSLTTLLEGMDHLWSQIELHGLQNKVTVIVGSDFGRTPFYNAGQGKDHWNITSVMAMGAGITGNRVIGATDHNFEALKLNPNTLEPHSAGIIVTPMHIHRALRDFMGVPKAYDAQFPINVERIPLFG